MPGLATYLCDDWAQFPREMHVSARWRGFGRCGSAEIAARAAGVTSGDGQLGEIRSWYRGAVAKGITDNQHRRRQIARDGLRLARRFHDHQDMILQFATDLTVVGCISNEAERGVRPVKVQQRTSGGSWRSACRR